MGHISWKEYSIRENVSRKTTQWKDISLGDISIEEITERKTISPKSNEEIQGGKAISLISNERICSLESI